jgi:Concanavalin A-like lectin/glucanases superfamily
MRKLLSVLFLLFISALSFAGTCGNGYGHSSQIILQKAVGSDQSNFPYPLVGTYSVLKTAANGGQVQNTANNSIGVSGPADLVFCDAASGGNALKYEVAQYDPLTSDFEIWVQIPTLHTATNDSIYLFLNNSGVSTSQQDLSMWTDANYGAVYHFGDGTTLSLKDSTTNGNNATNVNTVTAAAGQIGGAAATNGSSSYLRITDSASVKPTSAITMEGWAYPTSTSSCKWMISRDYLANGTWNDPYIAWGLAFNCSSANKTMAVVDTTNNTAYADTTSTTSLSLNQWAYLAATYDGTTVRNYINAAANGTTSKTGSVRYSGNTSDPVLGVRSPYSLAEYWAGRYDEIRISSVARSANWLSTTYNVTTLPSFQIVGQTFSTPTIVNIGTCASNTIGGTLTCSMPFPVTSGGIMVASISGNGGGVCSSGSITDTLGLTYTNHVTSHVTAFVDGYMCVQSAPITTAGADTLSMPISGAEWAVIYEVKSATQGGVATTSTTSNQPSTLTATAPTSNSILFCNTMGVAGSTTPSTYTLRTVAGFDPAFSLRYLSSANGIVSSGSQSCSFDTGSGGTMAIFGLSVPIKRVRPAIMY